MTHVPLPTGMLADLIADADRRTARALAMRGRTVAESALLGTSVGLSKPNQWRAEWSRSATLQERFISADDYAAAMAAAERNRPSPPPTASAPAAPARASAPIATTIASGDFAMSMTNEQRCAAIDALALPGHDALIATLKADQTITPSMAALRVMTAERARRDASSPTTPSRATLAARPFASAASMTSEMKQWEAEWAASESLRAEFPSGTSYAHFRWASATGRIGPGVGGRTIGPVVARSFLTGPGKDPAKA